METSTEIVPLDSELASAAEAENYSEVMDPQEFMPPSREIVDQEGIARRVYKFTTKEGNSVDVLFYSDGELPFSTEVVNGRDGYILGDVPDWREREDWDGFVQGVRSASVTHDHPTNLNGQDFQEAVRGDRAVLMVQNRMDHLIDAAAVLGIVSPELQEMRKKASGHILDDEAYEVIDRIIAANLYEEDGKLRDRKGYEGEALTLLSWMGSQKAEHELNSRMIFMMEQEEALQADLMRNMVEDNLMPGVEDQEALDPEGLICVHLTNYPPRLEDGRYSLQSTYDARAWKYPRQTIHFSLNHSVESHSGGNWDRQEYAVIAPFSDMIVESGKPSVLNTVDTYYEVSPGQEVRLPESAYVFRPGGVREGRIFEDARVRNVVHIKSSDFTSQDVMVLSGLLTDFSKQNLNWVMRNEFVRILLHGYGEDDELGMYERVDKSIAPYISRRDYERLKDYLQQTQIIDAKVNMLEKMGSAGVDEVVSSIFSDLQIEPQPDPLLVQQLGKSFQAFMKNIALRLAVAQKISKLGYEVHDGGSWAWDDSQAVTQQTQRLGLQLGVPVMPHFISSSCMIESKFLGGYVVDAGLDQKLLDGEIGAEEYREKWRSTLDHIGPKLSRANKRLLYNEGII